MSSTMFNVQPPLVSARVSAPSQFRRRYLRILLWAFTLFGFARVVTYLPTMFALHASGDSSQHSLWTWCMWMGSNLTMAAWLYETEGQRLSGPARLSLANALMCALVSGQIVVLRYGS